MPDAAGEISVEFRARARDIGADLWRACFPPPLEGLFWYETLEESGLGDQFEFRYALIRARGEPVGIAPCFIHDVPIALVAPRPVALGIGLVSRVFPRAGVQRTFFVGSPCSDEGTIGLVPGSDLAVLAAALGGAMRDEARREGASLVVFKDLPREARDALAGPCSGLGYFPMASYPGTIASLPPPDKQAYLRSLSHLRRHNLLKKLRRSAESLPLVTTVVEHPSGPELEEINALFLRTYEKGRTKFERLGPPFFAAVAARPESSFILQRDPRDGRLAAFMLVFHLGRRVINKFIGLDYGRGDRAYLYFRLFDAALDLAYARGATEIQSGQTGYRAKLDLGHGLFPLFNLVRHRNRVVNAVYRAIGSRVSWASLDPDLEAYLRTHPDRDLSR